MGIPSFLAREQRTQPTMIVGAESRPGDLNARCRYTIAAAKISRAHPCAQRRGNNDEMKQIMMVSKHANS